MHTQSSRPGPLVEERVETPLLRAFVYRHGQVCCTAAFDQRRVVIGRAPELDLVLDCDTVSRMHAVLHVDGGAMVIEDLQSRNGVWIAGQPVERTALRPWEPVAIGPFVLRFHLDRQARRSDGADADGEATSEAWALQSFGPAGGDVFPMADLLEPEVRPGPRGPGAGRPLSDRPITLVTRAPELRRTSGLHPIERPFRNPTADGEGEEGDPA